MNVTIDKRELEQVLARCVPVAEKKATLVALQSVKLTAKKNALTVEATDLRIHIRGTAPAEVKQPGAVLVNARDFYDRIKVMPDGPVALSDTATTLTIAHSTARRRYVVPMASADDFPSSEDLDTPTTIAIPAATLQRLVKSSSYAISQDESRPILAGSLLEISAGMIRMVATDGHRLALGEAKIETEELISVLIPRKGVTELQHMAGSSDDEDAFVTIGVSKNGAKLAMTSGRYKAACNLIDGTFPPYQQVIPDRSRFKSAQADVLAMAQAIKACSVGGSREVPVKITFTDGSIALSSESPEHGNADDEVTSTGYAGSPLMIAINSSYALESLGSVFDSSVVFYFDGELDPLIMTGAEDESMLAVLMPVRV